MKKALLLMSVFVLVLMGAGCGSGSYDWEDDWEAEWEAEFGDWEDYDWSYDSTPSANVIAPTSVSVGEEFTVVATITHDADTDQILHSIDIGETYLDGIALLSSDPSYTETYLLDDGTYTHTLMADAPAGEALVVTFNMMALEAGNYKGAFDVCFDDGLNCSFYTVSTYVQ